MSYAKRRVEGELIGNKKSKLAGKEFIGTSELKTDNHFHKFDDGFVALYESKGLKNEALRIFIVRHGVVDIISVAPAKRLRLNIDGKDMTAKRITIEW